MLQVQSKPIRTVLKYQVVITLLAGLVLAGWGGPDWGVSALLGGAVSIVAGAAYGVVISRIGRGSAEQALRGMLRAEAVKVLVIVAGLWLVFSTYDEVFGPGFVGTFILATLVFSFAVFVRDKSS